VRNIDFHPFSGKLYSASDDGELKVWDLNYEKMLQKYNIYDEEKRPLNQVTHPADFYSAKSCPLTMTSSKSGNLVFVALSDNTLRMIDSRICDKQGNLLNKILKEQGHTSFVKSILCSSDESVLYTGGVDGTLKIWDISTAKVI